MAKARRKQHTVIRMGASAFTLTSTKGDKSLSLDLSKAGANDLRTVALTVSELHRIKFPQLKVRGKFAKRGTPQLRPTGRNGFPQAHSFNSEVNPA